MTIAEFFDAHQSAAIALGDVFDASRVDLKRVTADDRSRFKGALPDRYEIVPSCHILG